LIAALIAMSFLFGLHHHLSLEHLREYRHQMTAWVDARPVIAGAVFMLVYAIAIVVIPPTGAAMTVIGGFLFGTWVGSALVVIGATLGATALFVVARMSIGQFLEDRAGPAVRRMEQGFRDHALSYMLVLRLVPLFPFWLVNLAPAFLAVPLRTYVLGTFFGIIPGTVVFAAFGSGLGTVLDSDQPISLAGVLTPEIVGALCGLAVLALLPVGYKRWKRRTHGGPASRPGPAP
jgi:uncharacterized membrane protein YdjX (TVP38/TMEM64 family)